VRKEIPAGFLIAARRVLHDASLLLERLFSGSRLRYSVKVVLNDCQNSPETISTRSKTLSNSYHSMAHSLLAHFIKKYISKTFPLLKKSHFQPASEQL